ncbi:hypothetical protein C8Q72DRAFT_887095 [Fomitopsis betulina]|nr:hypothetical protein C8Q72DRAFT_887095 [Fomitopsis betulina]
MKVVSSEIEAYYDITVQFRIDNVRGYIEHGDAQDQSPEHQRSQDFGPGWHFEWFRMKVDDNTNQPEGACQWALAIYLYTGSCGYPEPVTWSLEAKPLKGDRRYMKMNMVVTNTFTDGDGWGWPTFVSKSKWDSYTTLQEDNAVRITAKVRARMAPTPSLDKCLNIAHKFVTSENRLSDICFMANSTRKGVGQTSKPQKLFVDRGVIWRNCPPLLSHCDYPNSVRGVMSGLLDGTRPGHVGSGTSTRDDDDELDADVDSDFEDEEEEPVSTDEPSPANSNRGKQSETFVVDHAVASSMGEETPAHDTHFLRDDGYASVPNADSVVFGIMSQEGATSLLGDAEWVLEDIISDEENKLSTCGADKDVGSKPPRLLWSSSEGVLDIDDAMLSSIHTRGDHKARQDVASPEPVCPSRRPDSPPLSDDARVIKVTVASTTWEAFLFSLYTGVIAFAPLRSQGKAARKDFITAYKEKNPHRPAPCSCKSIYRIASKLDMQDLQALALKELGTHLSKDNIVAEVFTKCASRHDDVRELGVRVLKEHWAELKGTVEMSDILKKVVRCNMAHATAIMGALVGITL